MVKIYRIKRRNARNGSGIGWPFFFIGLLFFLVFGGFTLHNIKIYRSMDAKTDAYLVEINSHKDSEGSTLYTPTYYYRVNGKEYQYTASFSTNVGLKKMRENKTIYYFSDDPSRAFADYEKGIFWMLGIMLIVPIIFMVVGLSQVEFPLKKHKRHRDLQTYGTLYKNLPYKMVTTGIVANYKRIWTIQVEFRHPSGQILYLQGSPRYDGKFFDEDGYVDLLIDLENPENYYLDFNIEETKC